MQIRSACCYYAEFVFSSVVELAQHRTQLGHEDKPHLLAWMSFLGRVNCGKQSVFAEETLGHNLQLPEGNAKSDPKTKGREQMRMSLSICLLGRKG